MGKQKNIEAAVENMIKELLILCNRYPILHRILFQIRTTGEFISQFKHKIPSINVESIDSQPEFIEKEFEKKLISFLEPFRKAEERIKKEEDVLIAENKLKKYTHYFYIEDVLIELGHIESNYEKTIYLKYLKSEYPLHLRRRENIFKDEMNTIVKTNFNDFLNNIHLTFQLIGDKINRQPSLNMINFPFPDFTFQEQIDMKLEYYEDLLKIEKKYKKIAENGKEKTTTQPKSPVKFIGKIPDLVRIFESMLQSKIIESKLNAKKITDLFCIDSTNPNSAYRKAKTTIVQTGSKSIQPEYFNFVQLSLTHLKENELTEIESIVKHIKKFNHPDKIKEFRKNLVALPE